MRAISERPAARCDPTRQVSQSALTERGDRLTSRLVVPTVRLGRAARRITIPDPLWVRAFVIRPRSAEDHSYVARRRISR